MSLPAEFFLDNLPLLCKAIRRLRADNRSFGSEPVRFPCEQKTGLMAKIENRK
jgi:hypothetical protein